MSAPREPGEPGAPSIAAELDRLEQIVRALEADDLDLDAALRLFEEGVARLRSARARLATAQLRVRGVLEDADGTLRDVPRND
jgi:exodeoxyribonuclease VII small subunit